MVLSAIAAVLLGAAVLAVLPSARAAANGTYEDVFPSSGSFSGDTGTLSWSGPWSEIGESDGAGAGLVSVGSWALRCASFNCLRVNDQLPGTNMGAQRSADLSGAGAAVLTFNYALEQDNPGGTSFDLDISPNGSAPWTTLATYVVSASVDAPMPQAFDITPYIGSNTTIRVTSSNDNHSDEIYLDDVRIEAIPAADTNPHLWFSILDDSSTPPPPPTSIHDGAVMGLDDPGLRYEPDTSGGTIDLVSDFEVHFSSGVDISGLHLMGSTMTVGGMSLEAGDLLFSTAIDTTLTGTNGSTTVQKSDVIRFRPATPGDYTSGSFTVFLDNPLGADIRDMTLVESTTVTGDQTLAAGTVLLARSGGAEDEDVWKYAVTSAGAGSTSGTVTKLIEGTEIGIDGQIWGLELVEDGFGWPFPRGAIVLALEKAQTVGTTSTSVTKRDLVSLVVARTSVSGTARVMAIVALEGDDLGFDSDAERFDAIAFSSLDYPPVFDQDLGDRTDAEGSAVSISASATDPLGESITYSASGLPAGVTIDTDSGLVSGTISYTAAAGSPYSVTLTVTDAGGTTDVDTFSWTVTNVNRAPTTTTPGNQTTAEGAAVSVAVAGSDPDGDTLTWTASGLPAGLSIASGTGAISGTVAYTASPGSPYAVTVRATDNGSPSLYVEVAFTWTVVDTNRAPAVTTPGNQANAEGSTVSLGIAGSDPDGDTLTWTATGLPAGLTIGSSSGLISGTLLYDAAAGSPYSVTVRATDNGTPNMHTEVAFIWSVVNANRSPVVIGPSDRSNSEADVVAFAVAGSDPDGDTLAWTATGLPPGLSIASGTGVVSGTVGYDAAGSSPYTVTVRATDNGSPNLFDEAAFVWTVTNTNRAPVFSAGLPNRTDPESAVVTLTATAVDQDGDTLVYSATGLPPGIAVHPTTGAIVGTIDYSASAGSPFSVIIQAEDPGGLLAEMGFTWTVTDVPVALEITKVSDATGSVRPGDALAYTITVTNTSSVIHRNAAVADPVPAGTTYFSGSADVTRAAAAADTFETGDYTGSTGSVAWGGSWAESGDDGSSAGGVAVVEADAHCRETACLRIGGDEVNLDGVAVTRAIDLDGASAPRLGLAYQRVLLGTPGGSVTVQARGGGSGWLTLATIDLAATSGWSNLDLDMSTVAASDTEIRLLGSGTGVESVVSVDDVRVVTGATVSLAGAAPPALLSGVDLWPGEVLEVGFLVVLDEPNAQTQLTNTATVTSAQLTAGASDSAVDFVDQPPAFATQPPDRVDAEGDVIAFAIDAGDPEGGAVAYDASGLPAGIGIDPASGVISGVIDYTAAVSSPYSVVITASDEAGLTDTAGFQWTVVDTNRAPAVTNPGSLGAAEGDPVTLAMSASDPDGDTLTWMATGLPGGLTIGSASGVVSGTVSYSAAGSTYSVTVRATDDGAPNRFGETSFIWTITDTNRPPSVTGAGPQSDAEGSAVSLDVAGSDPDGDSLTWSAVGLPPGLTIDPVGGVIAGTITFTASPGSPYSVTVRATDDGSPSLNDESSFAWSVSDTNRAPIVANPGNRSSAEGAVISMPVSGSDPDGDTLTWSASGLPTGLSISPSTGVVSGSISYAASPASPFDVIIRATDDGAPTRYTEVSFSWTVDDTNRPPTIVDPGVQNGAEGQAVTLPMTGSDPDGDGLTWSATNLPTSLVIDPVSGSIQGSLGFTSAGTRTVTVRATDNGIPSLYGEVSFSWTVGDTNRAPTLQNPGDQT
ncbi:MAG: putative Ig domain-containing protein, partial [Actinomycetota bacterium]